MTPIRVLVAGWPAGLSAAVHGATEQEPDLEVVDVTGGEIELLLRVGETGADVVVVGMSGHAMPVVAERLIDEYPGVGVLALDLSTDEGLLYRLRPWADFIPRLLPDGLPDVLRLAAAV